MRNKCNLAGSVFFLLAMLMGLAHARNKPDILDSKTGRIFSARADSRLYTFTEDGNNWVYRPEIPLEDYYHTGFNAMAYDGKDTYVIVGDYATIWYLKTDGGNTKWKQAKVSFGEANFQAVEYGNGRFVAVALQGTIWYSDDGVNWQMSSGSDLPYYDPNLYDVIYANGVFVAVGGENHDDAAITLSSSDGKTWRKTSLGHLGKFKSVTYGNNTFVAVGENANIYLSDDKGQTWGYASPKGAGATVFNAVTYHDGMFVAVGEGSSIWHSTDGSNWAPAQGNIHPSSMVFSDVTFGNGMFVAVGKVPWHYLDSTETPIWRSADGITWEPANGIVFDGCTADLPSFNVVYFDGTDFVATVRTASPDFPEYYSHDGVIWHSNQNRHDINECKKGPPPASS